MIPPVAAAAAFFFCLTFRFISPQITAKADSLQPVHYTFGFPFDHTYYSELAVESPASISNNALQVTPDSSGNFTLVNRSGRIFYNHTFRLWDNEAAGYGGGGNVTVASFNTTFIINIYRNNDSVPGEGLTFVVAPDVDIPPGSDGEYLGLTNSTTDGRPSNRLLAVEFDTFKQDFDPDNNHVGLNVNSVRSNKTTSLSSFNITLAPNGTKFHKVWVQYNGVKKTLAVFMAELDDAYQPAPLPETPVLTAAELDLSSIVNKDSYFGFSASTGNSTSELHCVLSWNLTVEVFPGSGGRGGGWVGVVAGVAVGVGLAVLLVGAGLWYYYRRKGRKAADLNILGALKSLPGTPREFEFKDLKKATGNFDEKNKLGQGGYGVVYKGILPVENLAVAVKKFCRDDLKSKDDFLAELTIINRLRHRHLVRLCGWCHKNGMLLLVYEYMPNGSLDTHIFCGPEKTPLTWSLRYKIFTGVASALHYLHNEYDNKVIHRDLKASNVMLDSQFNARLGDFGLARALDQEKTSYAEMEGVHGTMGYIAPEVFHTGRATRESDVYAFGALLLEVACGHRPWTKLSGFSSLVDWVWSLHRERRILAAVDGRLEKNYVAEEAERVLLLGLACSHPIAAERPKTQAIVQILSGSVPVPTVPPFRPAFVWPAMGPVDTSMEIITADTTPMASSHFESEWTPRSTYREDD
ncbi:hypothetical protein Ancab_026720 [Ancistrocladus abbreviatus]